MSQYFSLVDKTYKYKTGIIDKVTVELTCIEPLPEDMKAYIGVDVLDEDGTVISAGKPDASSFYNYNVLRQASPGQTVTIEIQNYQNVRDEKPAKIRLSSVVENDPTVRSSAASPIIDEDVTPALAKEESSMSSENYDNNDDSNSGSKDWDALLRSYEQYVNKYISLMKKAKNGDMSAMTEYVEFLQKAQELSREMDGAQGDMSASQWSRYMRITSKLAEAAQEMQ